MGIISKLRESTGTSEPYVDIKTRPLYDYPRNDSAYTIKNQNISWKYIFGIDILSADPVFLEKFLTNTNCKYSNIIHAILLDYNIRNVFFNVLHFATDDGSKLQTLAYNLFEVICAKKPKLPACINAFCKFVTAIFPNMREYLEKYCQDEISMWVAYTRLLGNCNWNRVVEETTSNHDNLIWYQGAVNCTELFKLIGPAEVDLLVKNLLFTAEIFTNEPNYVIMRNLVQYLNAAKPKLKSETQNLIQKACLVIICDLNIIAAMTIELAFLRLYEAVDLSEQKYFTLGKITQEEFREAIFNKLHNPIQNKFTGLTTDKNLVFDQAIFSEELQFIINCFMSRFHDFGIIKNCCMRLDRYLEIVNIKYNINLQRINILYIILLNFSKSQYREIFLQLKSSIANFIFYKIPDFYNFIIDPETKFGFNFDAEYLFSKPYERFVIREPDTFPLMRLLPIFGLSVREVGPEMRKFMRSVMRFETAKLLLETWKHYSEVVMYVAPKYRVYIINCVKVIGCFVYAILDYIKLYNLGYDQIRDLFIHLMHLFGPRAYCEFILTCYTNQKLPEFREELYYIRDNTLSFAKDIITDIKQKFSPLIVDKQTLDNLTTLLFIFTKIGFYKIVLDRYVCNVIRKYDQQLDCADMTEKLMATENGKLITDLQKKLVVNKTFKETNTEAIANYRFVTQDHIDLCKFAADYTSWMNQLMIVIREIIINDGRQLADDLKMLIQLDSMFGVE